AEDGLLRPRRTVDRFRQSETIGVVGQTYRTAEPGLQILLQWVADQPGGVRVFDNPGDRRDRPRHADPDARRFAERPLDLADESNYHVQCCGIAAPGRCHATAEKSGS